MNCSIILKSVEYNDKRDSAMTNTQDLKDDQTEK